MYLTEQTDKPTVAERDRLAIEITEAMVQAGVEEMRERVFGEPLSEIVTGVYLAMEIQRLDSLGQLRRIGEDDVHEDQRHLGEPGG